ncbi:MAG: cysteine synthase A [Bacilli bacterium]|jgi:cysteine synthase A|nr:cysteine synthase A [Bacilli bacterium]
MLVNKIEELIGNTPIIKLNKLVDDNSAEVYVKLESFNLTGNIKIRPAYYMINDVLQKGILSKDNIIVEPTSGNTGIALAYIANLLGIEIYLIMPETMSIERRQIMEAYHAKIILTEGKLGMKGAIEKANELAQDHKYVLLQQFNNPANTLSHYETTAQEIINDFNNLDAFIAGVGTGGTITGIGKKLKENYDNIKVVAVEPQESAVLSGNKSGPHKIQGIGAGFIPEILDLSIVDEVVSVASDEVVAFVKEIYLQEGLFLGISSAANILAALQIAKQLGKNKKVLTIAPDGGDKYLSNNIFNYDE